jgi:hypothetical protein
VTSGYDIRRACYGVKIRPRETLYAYGDVDIQTASRQIQRPTDRDHFNATAHNYEGIPGLIRKYYGITPDGCLLVAIYLRESVAAANAFHTADWVAMATKRWAVTPQRQEWETPMVVESAERRLVAAG